MRAYAFPPALNTSDWHRPFYVTANGAAVTWNPPDDEVILGLSPDEALWSDYGWHVRGYPPGRPAASPPLVQASSNDGSGVVSLVSPGLIDILVPAATMRSFAPGEVNVGLRFQRASDGRTGGLFIGRLPILHGVV